MSLMTVAIFWSFFSVGFFAAGHVVRWIKQQGYERALQSPPAQLAITQANFEKNRDEALWKWHLGFRWDCSYAGSNRYRPFIPYDAPPHVPGKFDP